MAHANLSKPFILETDASDFALGSFLSQVKEDGCLHPIAFHSRKFEAAIKNYEVHEKEFLSIMEPFQQWLEGCSHQIMIYNDHKNLIYFQNGQVLNRCQACWAQFLAGFDFIIVYRLGSL